MGKHALESFVNNGRFRGADGSQYTTVAGVIRNSGSGWQLIDDELHTAINVDSVSNDTSKIVINYGGGSDLGTVVSLIATPDEALAVKGYTCGASVRPDHTQIRINRNYTLSDYVSFNGTSWDISNGNFTYDSWTNDAVKLAHEWMGPGAPGISIVNRSVSSGNPLVAVPTSGGGAAAAEETRIQFHRLDTGAKVLTPNTNMRFWVNRYHDGLVDPNEVNTTRYPLSNIWFFGVFKI